MIDLRKTPVNHHDEDCDDTCEKGKPQASCCDCCGCACPCACESCKCCA